MVEKRKKSLEEARARAEALRNREAGAGAGAGAEAEGNGGGYGDSSTAGDDSSGPMDGAMQIEDGDSVSVGENEIKPLPTLVPH